MGLITKEVEVVLANKNIKHFEDLGYPIPRKKDKWGKLRIPRGTVITVKVKDLPDGSRSLVDIECDQCGKELNDISWYIYNKLVNKHGYYYCHDCAMKLYGYDNLSKIKLLNTISFEQWCINNNKQDVLDRWDYDLNNCKPSEISYGTVKKFYFKCPKGVHDSELKEIQHFTNRHNKNINSKALDCKQCNSLGFIYPESLKYWSDKNKKSPYEYAHGSDSFVWFKCPNGKHIDYYRTISNSILCNFRCPECEYSKGEERISNELNNKNYIKTHQDEYDKLFDKCHNKYYIPQKTFNGLVGLKNGLLSYDFYIPKLNLLIEFQGEQHEHYCKWFHNSKEDFERQLEHDRRKREYAEKHNIKLLEIWYYDFDRIEEILSEYIG